jgi:hypothetical protein
MIVPSPPIFQVVALQMFYHQTSAIISRYLIGDTYAVDRISLIWRQLNKYT